MQQIDTHGTLSLEATRTATREQALKLRELWRMQLRLLEDMHGLPHSFQTKAEQASARSISTGRSDDRTNV